MKTVTLAFEQFGSPTDTPPLIILHGFFAAARNWRQIAQQLAAHFLVYVPDCRNHGASPHHADMDYPLMAADVVAFMEVRHIEQAYLLGHSMGGKTAMWCALHYPEKITKLIVADIAPVSYTHSFDKLLIALQSLPLAEIDSRKQADEYLAPLITELSYRQFLLQNLVAHEGHYRWRIDLDIFKATATNIVAFPETENLPPYQGDTLFLTGAQSNYVNAPSYAAFPQAHFYAIAKAGHWLHVQQPTIFVQRVTDFLQKT